MLKVMRAVVFWTLMLVGLAAAAGTLWVQYLLNHTDELLTVKLRETLRDMFPECRVELSRARIDLQGRIRAYDLHFSVPDATHTLLEIGEAVILVPREELTSPHPRIEQVRLLRPIVRAIQRKDGTWNLQTLKPVAGNAPPPEIRIEQGQILIQPWNAIAGASADLRLYNVAATIVPQGRRQFAFEVTALSDVAGEMEVAGATSPEEGSWSVTGSVKRLKLTKPASQFVAACFPSYQRTLDLATQKLLKYQMESESADRLFAAQAAARAAANQHANPDPNTAGSGAAAATTPATATSPLPAPTEPLAAETIETDPNAVLGLTAETDIDFNVDVAGPDALPDFRVSVDLRDGSFANQAIPYTLHKIALRFEADRREFILRRFSAEHGVTRTWASGRVPLTQGAEAGEIHAEVIDLELTDQLRSVLPLSWRATYTAFHARGRANITARLFCDSAGRWQLTSTLLPQKCTVLHDLFPYLVESVRGEAVYADNQLAVAVHGTAGSRKVRLEGTILSPGPHAEANLDIHVDGVLIDEKLRAACARYHAFVQALDLLQARGLADGRVHIHRPPGLSQPWSSSFYVRLRGASAIPRAFPYEVREITGVVEGGSDSWQFRDLVGRHGDTIVTASGSLQKNSDGLPVLTLDLTARQGLFDASVRAALLDERWQSFCREFSPKGNFDLDARLTWSPGLMPIVELNRVHVRNGSMLMQSFPIAIDDIEAIGSFKNQHLEITSFSGVHADTTITTAGFADFFDDEGWLVRLQNLEVDELEPDTRLRRALPGELRNVVDAIDPRGRMSLNGWIEFRGSPRERAKLTAAWDLEAVKSGATVTTGVDLEKVHGKVRFKGISTGQKVEGQGELAIDSLIIRGHQFTHVAGPFRLNGRELTLGAGLPNEAGAVRRADEAAARTPAITARFINGTVQMNGNALLDGKQTSYGLAIKLIDGRLENYADRYLREQRNLMGVMNGEMRLSGKGVDSQRLNGRGWLNIEPAALYELPVVMAVFKVLNFSPPDKTAFRKARLEFTIENRRVRFSRIDLVGDSISLVGLGEVKFNLDMYFKFISKMGQAQGPLPGIRELIGELTRGWIGVEVKGTLSNPGDPRIIPAPQLEDSFRTMLDVFDPNARPPARPFPAGLGRPRR